MAREASSRPPPCHARRVLLLLLLAVSGSGASPCSARQTGGQEGRRSRWHTAGQEETQLRHGHPLAFATSVILMVHVWFHMDEKQPRNSQPYGLSKHPNYRTLLSDPLGSSDRLRVLWAALRGARCVLWGFPLYFHSSP